MKDVSAKTANKAGEKKHAARQPAAKNADKSTALHCGYGQIGISAVAAAARYQGAAKNPAYAPAAIKPHDRAGKTVA